MKRNEHSIPDASVPASWRKSSYSGDSLEVNDASCPLMPVRDSKDATGPAIVFSATA